MVLAGLDFDTAIRAILVVLVGLVVLPGSIYLLLATNVGARLGFLLAFGGLSGWVFILGITWWLTPPAIGPRGNPPSWVPQEIVYGDPAGSPAEVLTDLPNTCWSSRSRDCTLSGGETLAEATLSDNPDLVTELGEDATLSEIANVAPDLFDDVDFGAWNLMPAGEAGEGVSAADAELVAQGVFDGAADYVVLDAWEQGGKDQLTDDPSRLDRILYKFTSTAQLTHPTRYMVVQLQPVLPVVTEPGEAPPVPQADPDQPVVNVLLVRDLGNLRVPAALVTLGSGLLLGTTAYALHRRDQLTDEHLAEA